MFFIFFHDDFFQNVVWHVIHVTFTVNCSVAVIHLAGRRGNRLIVTRNQSLALQSQGLHHLAALSPILVLDSSMRCGTATISCSNGTVQVCWPSIDDC